MGAAPFRSPAPGEGEGGRSLAPWAAEGLRLRCCPGVASRGAAAASRLIVFFLRLLMPRETARHVPKPAFLAERARGEEAA